MYAALPLGKVPSPTVVGITQRLTTHFAAGQKKSPTENRGRIVQLKRRDANKLANCAQRGHQCCAETDAEDSGSTEAI